MKPEFRLSELIGVDPIQNLRTDQSVLEIRSRHVIILL
jgi:hypothetical protein